MSEATDFGNLLRRLRNERDLSQSELAELANMSVEAISALERGFRKRPQMGTVDLLGAALALDRDHMQTLRESARAVPRPAAKAKADDTADDGANDLPVQLTSFVGRETEIAEIGTAIERQRFVSLVGPGGIGKTRVSLHVAQSLRKRGSTVGDIWFVELAPLAAPELVPATIASAMRLNPTSAADPIETLLHALAKRTGLLVLDNCEHVIDVAAPIVASILARCPGMRVLASSRQPLDIAGEVVYRLPTLPLPASVQLFADRARAADSRFAVTAENAATIATICERLDGIPLAIELAAPRSTMFAPHQLLNRLDDRFRLLAGGKRDALPRQQTLRALIDWSYELLRDDERTMFRALGIFVGTFTLEAAMGVAGTAIDATDAVDVLTALIDKSLVIVEDADDSKRFRLLESMRAYARETLEDKGELEAIALLHLRYLRDLFQESVARRERTGNGASHEQLFAIELGDVRSAADFALANDRVDIGGEMLAAINGISWTHIGHGTEGLARLQSFRDALADERPALVARLCAWIAVLARELGLRQSAGEASAMAVDRARAAQDPIVIATTLARHANTMVSLERFEEARVALEEAETYPAPSPMQRRRISEARANLARTSGDLDTAVRTWETIREHLRFLGDAGGERVAAVCLSECEFQRGNTALASAIIEAILPSTRAAADWNLYARALCDLAACAIAVGATEDGRHYAEEATRLTAERDRTSSHLLTSLHLLSLLHARLGDAARAARISRFTTDAGRAREIRGEYIATWAHDRLRSEYGEAMADLENVHVNMTLDATIAMALSMRES